jgi:hypothetical protein
LPATAVASQASIETTAPTRPSQIAASNFSKPGRATPPIVYIRQSTADKVANNLESKRRQYGLADRAQQLGWNDVVISATILAAPAADEQDQSGAPLPSGSSTRYLVAAVRIGCQQPSFEAHRPQFAALATDPKLEYSS